MLIYFLGYKSIEEKCGVVHCKWTFSGKVLIFWFHNGNVIPEFQDTHAIFNSRMLTHTNEDLRPTIGFKTYNWSNLSFAN